MNKHYEKILLLISLVALGSSAWYYTAVQKTAQSDAQTDAQVLAMQPSGAKWEDVSIKISDRGTSEWPEVKAQDEDGVWMYQVFTSPKIYLDVDGSFLARPPNITATPPNVFGFRYGEVKNVVYNILCRGFTYDADNKAMIQLFDTKANRRMTGRLNEEMLVDVADKTGRTTQVRTGITVKSFERVMRKYDDGSIRPVITVVLFDAALGREIAIEQGKNTYVEENRALLLNPDMGQDRPWLIKAVGDKFEGNGSSYVVKELDFDKGYVVIERVIERKGSSNITQLKKLSKEGIIDVK